jgi:small subunit ribosomal protein S5
LKLVQRKRVVRVTKGGRRFSVQTLVVLGDRSGRVGVGIGKAGLLKKACYEGKKDALKNVVEVCVTKEGSIPYESYGRSGGAKVFLRPRPPGAGVLASGPVRTVLEMAGVKNVSAKRLGSRTAVNNARATVGALSEM